MTLGIVLLPLVGSLLAGLGGHRLGIKGSQLITTVGVGLAAAGSILSFIRTGLGGEIIHLEVLRWLEVGMLECHWSVYVDSVTVVMLVVVTSVSFCVHIYSIEYMRGDPHTPRFMSYLSLFTFFMLVLISSDNLVQLFVGWEGVGLCSYLLINYWYTRIEANKAAMKAVIVNRVGDVGLLLGMMGAFFVYESLDYGTIFATTYGVAESAWLPWIGIALFVGAVGKSAQVGLHTWLPDAMEGPTPVSALIHAATMVTAGVFLLIRCSPFYEYVPVVLYYITLVGALTAFMAATTGLVQFDMKRVVAYSTCSQLGYMVFGCGLSAYSVSLFHLYNHAFFKALLFLSCGAVIHALHDEQDMRRMGGLLGILPMTAMLFMIGSLALMGFPFLTGFYSKDVLIEVAYARFSVDGAFAHWLGSISALFTAFYSFRLYYLTFLDRAKGPRGSIEAAHDAPLLMTIPLLILAMASIFIGYVSKDLFVGLGTDFFMGGVTTVSYVDSEFLPTSIKLVPLVMTVAGTAAGFVIYQGQLQLVPRRVFAFLSQKWHWDNIYNNYVVTKLLNYGYRYTFLGLDRGLIELIGPTGLTRGFTSISRGLSNFHTGYIFHYLYVFTLCLTVSLTLASFVNVSLWAPFATYLFAFVAILSIAA